MRSGFWHIFVTIAALTIYIQTLCPTPFADYDSIEFAASVASNTLPHPSGYPLYHCLGRIVSTILPFSTAYSLNVMSAIFAALTVLFLSLVLGRLIKHRFLASAAALFLGTTPTFWKLSIIGEVYTLHTFMIALFLYLLILWREEEKQRWFIGAAVVLGLSALNHVTTIFLIIPAFIYLMLAGRIPRGRLVVGSALICLFIVTSGYLVYLPSLVLNGNGGLWRPFLSLDGTPSELSSIYNYVSGKFITDELWKPSNLGRGFYNLISHVRIELSPLPFFVVSEVNSMSLWFNHLLKYGLLVLALTGAYFNLRGEGPSFTFFAIFIATLTIFNAGFGTSIQDISTMYLPVYMFIVIWMCCAIKGILVVLRDHNARILEGLLYLLILILIILRIDNVYPYCDLSDYTATSKASRQLKEKLPIHSTFIGDYLASMLISLEHYENEVFSYVEVVPYGMTNIAFKKLYHHPDNNLKPLWDDRMKLAFTMHPESVFTNIPNPAFLEKFPKTRIETDDSIDLFKISPAKELTFIREADLPPSPTVINQIIDSHFLFAIDPLLVTEKYGRNSIAFKWYWKKRPAESEEEPSEVLLALVNDKSGKAVTVTNDATTPFMKWIPGKGNDLSKWPEGGILVEERRIFLPLDGTPSALRSGEAYNLEIFIKSTKQRLRLYSFCFGNPE
jgi:4-amino-4-deoxy-L-arabinose transferase-like glycosyltransferase